MSMANKHPFTAKSCLFMAWTLFFSLAAIRLAAETRQFSFFSSKGLPIKVLQQNEMPFVHAQLLVFLDGDTQNYNSLLIAQLTVMNVFARELNWPSNDLLDSFFRLGNDYQVEQTPEFIRISLNFLPDRLTAFTKLLREIYTYQSFHLNKFNLSKEKYWSLYTGTRDWKKEIAFLLAYQQMVGNFYFSQGLQVQEMVNGINLAQVRSFYLKTFRPDNSLLVLKGNINPYLALAQIERDLPISSPAPAKSKKEETAPNSSRRIFVLNNTASDAPTIYWFDAAPAMDDADYLPFFIGNFTLFGFPGGRIYQSERSQFLLGGYKVSTDIYPLKNFTVFCNYLRLNYNDLENFLLLVDQERKKFSAQPVAKKEYLDALNYYLGRNQVETGTFEYGVQQIIDRFQSQPASLSQPPHGLEFVRDVTFERVVQVMDDQMGYKHKTGSRERGIIVLIGNANLIMNALKAFKTDVVELRMD
ncbi:MAG: insulinase family protein [Candidatus Aminicenantes bacterium]|nr:insulinase family protein [Candidatus Aminicenantes bacterium]